MKSKWKLWLIPLVVVLAFGMYKGGNLWGKNEEPQKVSVQTVSAKSVEKIKIENALALTGSLEAFEEAVISSKVAGRVSQVAVENGDAVVPGQPLVLLERQDYVNALTASQAILKKAETNLISARTNYQRFQELHNQGAVSQKDFEDMEVALKVAEADASSAAASVANDEESLRNATVASPLRGVVANKNVTTGQVLTPGVTLMAVEDISSVYVVVNIEQKDLAKIKPGLKADVTVDAYGDKKFAGTVEVINPAANKSARVFETKIKVDNKEQLLKPGMFAKVQVKTGEAVEVLAVPQAALTTKQGMYFVFVPEGDKVKRVQVEIGQIHNQSVEIMKGLKEGQQVVITNVNKLKDQDKVKIAK